MRFVLQPEEFEAAAAKKPAGTAENSDRLWPRAHKGCLERTSCTGGLIVEFYDVKSRSKVKIGEANIVKKKMVKKTKTGTQTRYALIGEHDGRKLWKFVNEELFTKTNVKEVK